MTTRKDLRQRLGSAGWCGDMFTSTTSSAGAGGGNTLIDDKLTYADDKLNDMEIVITSSGADHNARGNIRVIADWSNGLHTLTPDREFSAQIDDNVDYEVHRVFSATRKNEAIREAMELAGFRWPRHVEDTSLTLLANTYAYALDSLAVPVDPEHGLLKVEYDTGASGTGLPYAVLDDDYWSLRNNDGVLTLQLSTIPIIGKTLRLTYEALPTTLIDDNTELKPADDRFENYIVAKAAALCFEKAAVDADENERGMYTSKMNYFNQMADGFLPRNAAAPGKVRLMDWEGAASRDTTTYTGRVRL